MKLPYRLILNLSICSILSACGGGQSDFNTTVRTTETAELSDQLLLISDGTSAIADLYISEVEMHQPHVASGVTSLPFELVVNNLSGAVEISDLSLALEYSTTADFNRVYRSALVDLRRIDDSDNQSLAISARSFLADLPSGNYLGRVIINPDWNLYFDNASRQPDYGQPFRYTPESDYSNNASSSFAIEVASDVVCVEDAFETPNALASATTITTGRNISASLCEDNNDLYAVTLAENSSTTLTFKDLDDNGDRTEYTVISPQFTLLKQHTLSPMGNEFTIDADTAGTYYIAIHGARSNYQIGRDTGERIAEHWFFSTDTVEGPNSWAYGPITLNRLQFDKQTLLHQTASCTRFVTEFVDDEPAAYTTPSHFTGTHEFRYISTDSFMLDGSLMYDWQIIQGDITHQSWYSNPYQGWAEKISDGGFRYWQYDGLSYVQCFII